MKVWVVTQWFPHEATDILGIYSSEDKANEAAREFEVSNSILQTEIEVDEWEVL